MELYPRVALFREEVPRVRDGHLRQKYEEN